MKKNQIKKFLQSIQDKVLSDSSICAYISPNKSRKQVYSITLKVPPSNEHILDEIENTLENYIVSYNYKERLTIPNLGHIELEIGFPYPMYNPKANTRSLSNRKHSLLTIKKYLSL